MDKLPLDLRYFTAVFFGALASYLYSKGWISDKAGFIQEATTLLSMVIPIGVWLYARFLRPSKPALDAARQADKILAGEKSSEIVVTAPGQPNIKVGKA